VAAVIVLTAASSSPAFAVTRHSDGTVSVVIRRMEGIAGANRRLALLGIRARAVGVSGYCSAAPPPALAQVTVATVRGRRVDWVGARPGRMTQTITPAQIPAGRTLVIPAVPGGAVVRLVQGRAVSGRVPACLPPVVFVRRGSGAAGGRIVICRAGIAQYPRLVVTGAGTNTNATNTNAIGTTGTGKTVTNFAPPPPATVTSTNGDAPTSTNAGTTTGTADQGTATNGATTTNGTATTGSPVGGTPVQLPPPLLRNCRLNVPRTAR
ncbi:MAG: hypothetical protein M3Y09_04445, partial [Actinomycetota bacterium]|nr:hypothetical protein [Actinomycetota bacterium]